MPLVELLYFDGCPNHLQFLPHLLDLLDAAGVRATVHQINVTDEAHAQRLRFLGSPTLRINGTDVEPAAEARTHYALQCRLYRTEAGLAGTPPDDWITMALARVRHGAPRNHVVGPGREGYPAVAVPPG